MGNLVADYVDSNRSTAGFTLEEITRIRRGFLLDPGELRTLLEGSPLVEDLCKLYLSEPDMQVSLIVPSNGIILEPLHQRDNGNNSI